MQKIETINTTVLFQRTVSLKKQNREIEKSLMRLIREKKVNKLHTENKNGQTSSKNYKIL